MTALQSRDTSSAGRSGRPGPVDLVIELRADARSPVQVTDSVLRFHYDVHGIVTVGSVAALPDLEALRCDPVERPDLVIEEGWFGSGHRGARPLVTQYAHAPLVSYEEHRGLRGSNFLIDMSDGVRVLAAPMLTNSPHVLYADLIKALLRFMVVPRGYALLERHCARGVRNRSAAVTIIDASGVIRPERSAPAEPSDEPIARSGDGDSALPFRYVAPALVMDGLGHDQLREREREILAQAARAVSARGLGRSRASAPDPAAPVTPV